MRRAAADHAGKRPRSWIFLYSIGDLSLLPIMLVGAEQSGYRGRSWISRTTVPKRG
jgi:hypothetical protein